MGNKDFFGNIAVSTKVAKNLLPEDFDENRPAVSGGKT
jgi:hypothetical protein